MADKQPPEAPSLAAWRLMEVEAAGRELRRLHAENATLQAGYDAAMLEIDHLRGATKSKLLAQPVAWMVYLPSIDTQHLYYSQEDMGYVDDVTNHADAEVTPLYEMAAPKAEVAPAGEYPPLPASKEQTMTEPTELLPCPFCGCAPTTTERPDNIDGTQFFYAIACYCSRYSACAHKMAIRKTPEIAKADAIAAWNTRTPQPSQPQAGAVPLTDEQVARIARSVLEAPAADGVAPAWELAVGIARAIEAAHGIGIKGGQHGTE